MLCADRFVEPALDDECGRYGDHELLFLKVTQFSLTLVNSASPWRGAANRGCDVPGIARDTVDSRNRNAAHSGLRLTTQLRKRSTTQVKILCSVEILFVSFHVYTGNLISNSTFTVNFLSFALDITRTVYTYSVALYLFLLL